MIERYLRSSFGYTLQLPPYSSPVDPLRKLISCFERKLGALAKYAFAAAMAVMLRTINVPSRGCDGISHDWSLMI